MCLEYRYRAQHTGQDSCATNVGSSPPNARLLALARGNITVPNSLSAPSLPALALSAYMLQHIKTFLYPPSPPSIPLLLTHTQPRTCSCVVCSLQATYLSHAHHLTPRPPLNTPFPGKPPPLLSPPHGALLCSLLPCTIFRSPSTTTPQLNHRPTAAPFNYPVASQAGCSLGT
jgi:hypothetical protein